nr:putative F-box protein At3g52320 [Ipomoea batatas]
MYEPNGDVVCNVSTGQRIFLPRIQYKDCALLLGYDSQSKRYKVLMSQKINRESEYKQWVFTVGVDRSWREIKNYGYFPFYPIDCYGYRYYSNTRVYNSSVYIDVRAKLKKMAGVSTLPQEILMEILSKLPAKSLVRFRCVSKFFCALIAGHGFGVLNRSLSLTLPSRAGFLISIEVRPPHPAPYRRVYYTLNFSEEENPRRLQANRVGFLDVEPFLLSSSSDGLICVSKPNGDVAVCNVSTGQRIFLPIIQYKDYTLLLAYYSQSKRYKVLMSTQMIDQESSMRNKLTYYEYKQWIFTVGVDRSWREINDYYSFPFYPIDGINSPL